MENKTVTYIITVHGMGEQRDNQTLMPVVSRLVDVIRDFDGNEKNPYPRNSLSLGQTTGQIQAHSGEPYDSFQGLTPLMLQSGCKKFSFNGREENPHDKTDCIRFADIWWQDILQEQWTKVGENTDIWVSAIVSRIFENDMHPPRLKNLMFTVEETIDILYYASKFKLKDLGKTVFEQYLGDVQVYAESPGCRQQAIARFHQQMDDLHNMRGGDDIEPQYFIIAHSLGTMMALEALLSGAQKDKDWMKHINAFITLGSPIDKIITLWDFNYRDLGNSIPNVRKIIPHYNYSDEQDPVGYYLDALAKKKSYQDLFIKKEDVVYNHSIVPGLAHISYWDDIPLFRHLVRHIIAPSVFNDRNMWFKRFVYPLVLLVTYFFIPLVISVVDLVTLTMALGAESWQARAMNSLIFVSVAWFGKNLLSLGISWRLSARRNPDHALYGDLDKKERFLRKVKLIRHDHLMKWGLWIMMIILSIVPAILFLFVPFGMKLVIPLPKFLPFLIISAISLVIVSMFFRLKLKRQAFRNYRLQKDRSTLLTVMLSLGLFAAGTWWMHNIEIPCGTNDTLHNIGEQSESGLIYFGGLMNAFICFTYSALRYFFEKRKLIKMDKEYDEKLKTPNLVF